MSDDASEEIVTFRLGPRDRAAIRRLIEAGEFRNRSDFLRLAVKNTLDAYIDRAPRAAMDLHIEGVDLPAADAAAPRRATGRGRTR